MSQPGLAISTVFVSWDVFWSLHQLPTAVWQSPSRQHVSGSQLGAAIVKGGKAGFCFPCLSYSGTISYLDHHLIRKGRSIWDQAHLLAHFKSLVAALQLPSVSKASPTFKPKVMRQHFHSTPHEVGKCTGLMEVEREGANISWRIHHSSLFPWFCQSYLFILEVLF